MNNSPQFLSGVGLSLLLAACAECYGAAVKAEAVGYTERTIYHSPETPGYTSWIGLWQLPDGRLRFDCHQLTGPKEAPVSTVPVLESRDGGGTWTRLNADTPAQDVLGHQEYYQVSREGCRGMAVLPEGTLVRPVWPPADKNQSGSVRRSTDRGKTWSGPIYFLPFEEYRTWPTLIRPLRDGRLVLYAGCCKRGSWSNDTDALKYMTKMMFVSADKGRSWSRPIVLMPTEVGTCEESDFCELPNGDLFWIHRAEHFPDHRTEISPLAERMGPDCPNGYSDRMQSIAQKRGDTFLPGKCEPAPFRHGGFPLVLYTREGLILYLATDGIYWTADVGKTWTRLNIPGTAYYPKAVQLQDGTILCIGHVGGDDKYGTVDQRIRQQTFRLAVSRH
jgi:hypothetical protein